MEKKRTTPCGEICGTQSPWEGVTAYKGIRYATARRWEYPKLVTAWQGVYQATQYGACSYQPRAFLNEETMAEKVFYYNEFRRGEHYNYSEDCLFLNIWAPDDANNLPVILYIHGGGFVGGCGHEKHFDGPIWATKGVIAVTINYRLGPLGFACLPELAQKDGHTGNYGMYDQLAALQWVHDNIAAFGGDPNNITLMGQSAGAMSVQQHCISPLSKGLVAKAVMSSGGGVDKAFGDAPTMESQYEFWQKVMEQAGCTSAEQLRELPVEQLFEAWNTLKNQQQNQLTCMPCVDGLLLPCSGIEAIQQGSQHNIPYLIGSTSEDVVPPILYNMAKSWCKLQSQQGKQTSYGWHFERQLPGDDNGAWHSSDLWYWFGTLSHCWRPFTQRDQELSHQMVDYLVQFAKTGNPNNPNCPTWNPIDQQQEQMMVFSDTFTAMGDVDVDKLTHTMMTKPSVGE